ncbi:efflux RND transporter periplasmic adaptor subunit [Fodinibius salsisoli]|uniref:Efflux RND transporter periplasmic adaptor subunit n=1 Tax=Fodinibius salsisoli TaxID=2820877 RepID=A0ABT3PM74_9BACT|nr:efflux RND transporter periplasmic adaptor subunit [Fodinibius salsisoli]MCW9706269.1 efflux RND transporter periplasmic adaptor subunit [Fodinibius salsisoli]
MKKSVIYIAIAGIFIAGGIITGCGLNSNENGNSNTQSAQQQKQHSSEEGGQHAGESGDHSTEQQHSPESGDQYQEGGGYTGEVHLTEQQRQNLGINVETLDSGSAASTIARPANISYDLDNIAKVGPRLEAKVVKVLKDLGEQVTREEPVALMSSVELGKTKAEYLRLKARLKSEQARYEREQSLYEQQISSQAELLEAEASFQEAQAELNATAEALRLYGLTATDIQQIEAGSDQPLSQFYITSPIDGVIQERNLSPGQTVSSSETPVHVANLSQMWVMIDAYEQDIRYIEPGQTVNIAVRSIPNEIFEGTVDWISYALEEDTRTMPVRANLKNTDRQLRAGMFGTARIQTGRERSLAMIPVDAVQTIEGESRVFVPGREAGSFRPVAVRLGAENEGLVEIIAGLQPGDKAVTAGAFDLKSALTAQTRSASHGH